MSYGWLIKPKEGLCLQPGDMLVWQHSGVCELVVSDLDDELFPKNLVLQSVPVLQESVVRTSVLGHHFKTSRGFVILRRGRIVFRASRR